MLLHSSVCGRTTPLSQMTLILSWTPATPWGILVKSSFPKALCLVRNGRCSEATMLRVSLRTKQTNLNQQGKNSIQMKQYKITHTLLAGPWGSWVCLGPGVEAGQWCERRREPSPGGNTASHSAQHEPLWSLHGPPYLDEKKTARENCLFFCDYNCCLINFLIERVTHPAS